MLRHLFVVAAPFTSLAVVKDGHWRPGIGDPTLTGWLTTIAYFAAALLCLRSAFTKPANTAPIDITKHRIFWVLLCGAMLLLGINKQMDFQMWFWLTGRNIIMDMGWSEYGERLRRIMEKERNKRDD